MKTKILILMIGLVAMFNTQSVAQNFNVKGVGHIGINVPDLDGALTFFSDVLGFEKASELELLELDESWKKRYKIHKEAVIERIVVIQSSSGSKIELFQYKSEKSNKKLPFGEDPAWYHIAFYTDDIYKSVAYLKSKGITFLDDPFVNSNGELWSYFTSPWGCKIGPQFSITIYKRNHISR